MNSPAQFPAFASGEDEIAKKKPNQVTLFPFFLHKPQVSGHFIHKFIRRANARLSVYSFSQVSQSITGGGGTPAQLHQSTYILIDVHLAACEKYVKYTHQRKKKDATGSRRSAFDLRQSRGTSVYQEDGHLVTHAMMVNARSKRD